METGSERWKQSFSHWAVSTLDSQAAFAYNGTVVISVCENGRVQEEDLLRNSHIVAFSASDGTELWRFAPDRFMINLHMCTPGDGTLIFQDASTGVYRLDLGSGRLLWKTGKHELPEYRSSVSLGGAVCHGGRVFSVGHTGSDVSAERPGFLTAYAVENGNFLWEQWLPVTPNQAAAAGPSTAAGRGAVSWASARNPEPP
mmetsp:Transcript_29903/g.92938  ORF Transcript_29903/g.92938 Transcript_29903/m.92938 type:complete len:200 (-) Transcript_29903:160-759(-)